jgi:hypothetical protein
LVVGVDPAGYLFARVYAVLQGCEDLLAEEEAAGGVGGAEVFVVIEAGEDCRVVGQDEKLSGDGVGGLIAEDDAGIGPEIVKAALDGGFAY